MPKIMMACFVFSLAVPIFAQPSLDDVFKTKERAFVTVYLKYESWPQNLADQRAFTAMLQETTLENELGYGFQVVRRYQTVPALAGYIDQETYSKWRLAKKADRSQIESIDLDVAGKGFSFSSSGQGGLAESTPLIGATTLHNMGITGEGVEVAILDTGYDSDHGDLTSSLLTESCFCDNPRGGCCPNGSATQAGSGSAEDDHGHGSHVSGIVTSDGVVAGKGVAPNARITAVKVLDSNNSFNSTSDITAGLDWLYNNRPNVKVVSMSLFTFARATSACDDAASWTQALFRAVQNLVDRGVFVAAISGNDGVSGELPAPGCLSNVITVGASNKNDGVWTGSNSHPQVALLAPGVSIVSSAFGGGSVSFTGTSMACPHVAGSAALFYQANPNLTPHQIRDALISTGLPLTDQFGLTKPRINLEAAYQKLQGFNRWVPHITASNGGFQTTVHMYNRQVLLKKMQSIDLTPFDASGNPQTVRTVTLQPGELLVQNIETLFGGEPVSHFAISGSEEIKVNVAYQALSANAATAHVPEFGPSTTTTVFEPGEWDLVFDGMAVVNTGSAPSTLTVTQFDATGTIVNIKDYTENDAIGLFEKRLVLFSTDFNSSTGSYFKIETSGPCQVILLRGTYPGTSPAFLYQTVPLDSQTLDQILKTR